MEKDVRYVSPDGGAVIQLRKKLHGWSRPQLMTATGLNYSTISRVEAGHRAKLSTMTAIRDALGKRVSLDDIVLDFDDPSRASGEIRYTWDQIVVAARAVAQKLYSNGQLNIDAVLTFPGASAIFCGLVLRMLPLHIFMRIPVYSGIFVDGNEPTTERNRYYEAIQCDSFKVLIPRELLEDRDKKIVVIDDCVLTGGLMDSLIEFFNDHYNPSNVKFACGICFVGRSLPNSHLPEIVGLSKLERHIAFQLPWGTSYCFEHAFVQSGKEPK